MYVHESEPFSCVVLCSPSFPSDPLPHVPCLRESEKVRTRGCPADCPSCPPFLLYCLPLTVCCLLSECVCLTCSKSMCTTPPPLFTTFSSFFLSISRETSRAQFFLQFIRVVVNERVQFTQTRGRREDTHSHSLGEEIKQHSNLFLDRSRVRHQPCI